MAKLIEDLGFRAPPPDEEARILANHMRGRAWRAHEPRSTFLIPAAVLSGDPLISYSGMVPNAPLGLASVGAARLRERAAWFLLSPTWSIEGEDIAGNLRELAIRHRLECPNHKIIFVCNTPEEASLLQEHNEAALFYNKTANTLERIFRPLDGIRVEFDAIYNAQLAAWKRHELTLAIERCAFVCYRDESASGSADVQQLILARHGAVPGHVFINAFDGKNPPIRFPMPDVNRELNRASVGLCLSEREGAMFASTEYLLSGLPIVTTPSKGGRHVYHDREFCWTASADPRSVADAVYALKAKEIPRTYIRDRVLRRLEADRQRFLMLVSAMLEEGGSQRRLAGPWSLQKPATMEWLPAEDAVDRAAHGIVDAFGRAERGFLPWRVYRKWDRLKRRLMGG